MIKLDGNETGSMLLPWILYHRMQGVEHFLIYTEYPISSNQTEILRPLVEAGIVSLLNWLWPTKLGFSMQQAQQNSCLYQMRGISKWVALHDIDEFFVPLSQVRVVEFLQHPKNSVRAGIQTSSAYVHRNDVFPFQLGDLKASNKRSKIFAHEREKCIVKPMNIHTFSVHSASWKEGQIHKVSSSNEMRLDHFKQGIQEELIFMEHKDPMRVDIQRLIELIQQYHLKVGNRTTADGNLINMTVRNDNLF
eukprot:CAMPEP_0179445836 /NCGR_PEP_ID=MMETSP0799-20121207/29273_1 /TAXON_ID=46947 /ORGANISM="Geminigera cryophila, Strain CCMP2564" /LENGTH=248 /DNA_ID=CAMNT_0021234259 /DNA_START=923 /DNA_END=1669 /DNA_ORIENTATION=-